MNHDQHAEQDLAVMFTAEFWDDRYGSTDAIWSGNPNQRLVEQVAGLTPGNALDVGSGEGGDAIWLAQRGWRVTGVDVSRVGLDRAAARAAAVDEDAAGRITWRQADLLSWAPPQEYDLVTAHFMHLPGAAELVSLHRRLAAAVRPGGTLLVVGHHPSDLEVFSERHGSPEMLFTAEQVAGVLDPDDWEVQVTAKQPREATGPEGHVHTINDAVLKAVRRRG